MRLYTGCTKNLEKRLQKHHSGYVSYTKSRLPVSLLTYIVFPEKYTAYKFEKYLKTGSGRAFARKRLIPIVEFP